MKRMKPLARLLGIILFLTGILLMSAPFFLLWIFLGINKANIVMSTIMRIPMNMISDTKDGDELLLTHKEYDEKT